MYLWSTYNIPFCIRAHVVASVRNTSLMELRRSHFLTRLWSMFTLVGRRRLISPMGHCRRQCHMETWHCSMPMDKGRSTPRNSRYQAMYECDIYQKHKDCSIHVHIHVHIHVQLHYGKILRCTMCIIGGVHFACHLLHPIWLSSITLIHSCIHHITTRSNIMVPPW